jgi:carbamoyl-phosphate synthase small subunit
VTAPPTETRSRGADDCDVRRDPEREHPQALLVLADRGVFEGEAVGASSPGGWATGELVFNTVFSGYQEVVTDPSYAGQVVAFSYPHIGNYGVSPSDNEARRPWCNGIVVRDIAERPSSWRAAGSLGDFLIRNGLPGISGIDRIGSGTACQ